jgi:hypothetical protein
MSDAIKKAIEEMQTELQQQEQQVADTKKLINQLCGRAKMAPIYTDAELQVNMAVVAVQRNSFFGRPLQTCVREFLEMRKRSNLGPASLNQIFDALREGGYDLKTISANSEADQKRGVAITLAKNSATFIRLPTEDWGMRDWYPNVREKKNRASESGNGNEKTDDAVTSVEASGGETSDVSVAPIESNTTAAAA